MPLSSQAPFRMILTPLFTGDPQPAPISIQSGAKNGVVLGRNVTTQIKDIILSRVVCEVMVNSSAKMYLIMKKKSGQHHVYLDGSLVAGDMGSMVEMKTGSVLSLYENRFPYNVKLTTGIRHSDDESISVAVNRKKREEQAANERNQADNDEETNTFRLAQETIVQELTCSICMEIMLKATVVNPCGHCFCGECIEDIQQRDKECPNCRTAIKSKTWTRHTDSIIWGMVVRGEFEFDDAMHFISRSGKQPSSREMACLQRCTFQRKNKGDCLNSNQSRRQQQGHKRSRNDNNGEEMVSRKKKDARDIMSSNPFPVTSSVEGLSVDDAIIVD